METDARSVIRQGRLAVALNDGHAGSIRPLMAGESGPLMEIFEGMSAGSRHRRYLTATNRLTSHMVAAMTAVDHDRHFAWLASVDERPVGVARFVRLEGPGPAAEFAVEVVDDHHRRGIGRILLEATATVAIHRGIHLLVATLAPDNVPSRRLLAGFGARFRWTDGLLEAEAPLSLSSCTALDRSAVVELADRVLGLSRQRGLTGRPKAA